MKEKRTAHLSLNDDRNKVMTLKGESNTFCLINSFSPPPFSLKIPFFPRKKDMANETERQR